MDIKTRYQYFLARLNHEVSKLGHGGRNYIGKNIGQSGAYIGQLLNAKLNKKAGVDTQIAIANFISGNEERFIEEGRQIVEHGYIKAELPLFQMTATATHTPAPVINLQDEATKKHQIVIEGFKDRELAIKFNQVLVEIESLDSEDFQELYENALTKLNKLREKKGLAPLQNQKNGTNSNQQS
jgi:hypothetical protein